MDPSRAPAVQNATTPAPGGRGCLANQDVIINHKDLHKLWTFRSSVRAAASTAFWLIASGRDTRMSPGETTGKDRKRLDLGGNPFNRAKMMGEAPAV